MLLTYKYRLKDRRAKRLLVAYSSTINFVWNYCVETQRKVNQIYRNGSKINWPSQYDFTYLTRGSSQELGVHAQTIQGVCEQFVKSRDLHKKCPRFRKSLGAKRKLGWVPFQQQSRRIIGDNGIKYLGKVFRFFGAKRRPLPDIVKGGCFVEDSRGRWYVCLQVEVKSDQYHGQGAVGIDLGLKHFVTTSDGQKHAPLRAYANMEQKLAVAQKANKKSRIKSIHQKIRNQRNDFNHKLSRSLVNQYDSIFVGNVNSSKLGKTKMAKAIYDAGWSQFREMLRYKASRHGAKYLVVNEAYSSQTCSTCGKLPESRPKGIAGLGIRAWKCSLCGTNHDRDINAARNILKLGLSAQPRGDGSRRVA